MEEEQKPEGGVSKSMNKGLYIGVAVVFVLLLLAYFAFKGNYFNKASISDNTQFTNNSSDSLASPQNDISSAQESATTTPVKANVVEITSAGFVPSQMSIKVGDRVTWGNKSGGTANVSSDLHPTHLLYPPLNLGMVENGATLFLVFDKSGSFGYHNHLNSSLTGMIIVE